MSDEHIARVMELANPYGERSAKSFERAMRLANTFSGSPKAIGAQFERVGQLSNPQIAGLRNR